VTPGAQTRWGRKAELAPHWFWINNGESGVVFLSLIRSESALFKDGTRGVPKRGMSLWFNASFSGRRVNGKFAARLSAS
jgi:hypothetical protein